MYFRNLGLQKPSLDKCLKSRVSENASTDNVTNGLKHCCNLNDHNFTIFINQCKTIPLEKVFFSGIQNPKTLC